MGTEKVCNGMVGVGVGLFDGLPVGDGEGSDVDGERVGELEEGSKEG